MLLFVYMCLVSWPWQNTTHTFIFETNLVKKRWMENKELIKFEISSLLGSFVMNVAIIYLIWLVPNGKYGLILACFSEMFSSIHDVYDIVISLSLTYTYFCRSHLLCFQNDNGTVPLFSIPRGAIAENPFTSLLLCSCLPSNVTATSWYQQVGIEVNISSASLTLDVIASLSCTCP